MHRTDLDRARESQRILDAVSSGWATHTFGITRTTLKRWREVGIPPARYAEVVSAIRELTQQTAPLGESGAAGELLRLWTGAAPPPWATALTDQIKAMLDGNRKLLTEALQVVTEEQGDDTRRLVSEEVRRALDEVERKAPAQPGGAAHPVQNGTMLDEDEANGD